MNYLSRCFAPAKINLFLHVVAQRDDGYHLLQSVFQLLDWGDWLDFELRTDGQIVLATPLPNVDPLQDLTVRAAKLLQQETTSRLGVTIYLEKHLPLGGGLGGGSSDAATVLLALNRLWQLNLSREQLMQLGLRLGADVPFFVFGQNAFVEGIGERLQAIQTPALDATIFVPNVAVPTPQIFKSPDLCRSTPTCQFDEVQQAYQCGDFDFGHNDLESVAVNQFPLLREVVDQIKATTGLMPRMSGSGASFFLLERLSDAQKEQLRNLCQHRLQVFDVSFMQQNSMSVFA